MAARRIRDSPKPGLSAEHDLSLSLLDMFWSAGQTSAGVL